jgi:predicted HTH transcriptional regulator
MTITSLEDLAILVETTDVECKAAQGKSGKGEIPDSIWETYSAMANTNGGHIYLGLEETETHGFILRGIQKPELLLKSFWDTIHNAKKISKDILQDQDAQIIAIEDKKILELTIPRAERHVKPIYVGDNPLTGTYIRRHEGDYRANEETVRRMMAEAIEDSRDDRIIEGFGLDDLDINTLNAYRNRFSASKPENPLNDLAMETFLVRIGAMRKDRATGKIGLTLAGLLMFGRYETITEALPNYMVDYQERPEPKKEARWIDRVVPDGTWSGNLYDFYQKVIRKLTADLKIPFALNGETRIDDTPIHQALREALTNTLIHADYTGRVSVLVVKRPDMFGFRNPGLMRVSIDQAFLGGISDCRNHRIQDMFRYIGLGDHAGSGLPIILKSWKSQHWRTPLLYENREYEQTLLELRTISLYPDESIAHLRELFGERFTALSELGRIILATAETEDLVTHSRIKDLTTEHPKDITAEFMRLVKDGMLVKHGETRAAEYTLPGKSYRAFAEVPEDSGSPDLTLNSPDLPLNSPDLPLNSPDLPLNSPDLATLLTGKLSEWNLPKMPRKLDANRMQELILLLCRDQWLTLSELGALLERDSKALQDQYLTPMLAAEKIQLRYPETPNHPKQAYGIVECKAARGRKGATD